MKKLFLSIAVVGAVCLTSCGNSQQAAQDKGEAIKAKIENCSDPDSLKIYVDEAKAYADELVKAGKDDAAQTFIQEVEPAVKAKDATAAGAFTALGLKAKADSAYEAAKEATKEAVDSTKAAVNAAADAAAAKVEQGKEAVAEKVEQGKEAVAEKAAEAKEAGKNAVDAAKTKTAEAAHKGADKVKDLLGK